VTGPEHAGAQSVREMFDLIAPSYDLQNTIFSLDRDRAWRRRAAQLAQLQSGDLALDLCTGTGKLARQMAPQVAPNGWVIGIDFSDGMLARATAAARVEYRLGDVSRLPFADGSAAAVTVAFGLRNLVHRDAALREMHRVLRPGGRAVILEFSPPGDGLIGRLYRIYLTRVMPAVAGVIRREQGNAYRYLAESIDAFPSPAELSRQISAAGFSQVRRYPMTFGIVTIHVGVRGGSA
jgi:demethylmenaquinone methyltransferase/2-methoxy-6-polyprenyl-1,4-benzoquinol methylase